MGTRFYFRNLDAAAPMPTARQGSDSIAAEHTWGNAAQPLRLLTYPGSIRVINGGTITEPGVNPHYGYWGTWISEPLTKQTIGGTITVLSGDFQAGSVSHYMFVRILIYVWKADDSGVRGTLLALTTNGVVCNITSETLQSFFSGAALANVNAEAGDKLVVELYSEEQNSKTLEYVHYFHFNNSVGSGNESYIEFSQSLGWHQRLSQGMTVGQTCILTKIAGALAQVCIQGITIGHIVGKGWTYHISQGITVSDKLIKHIRKLVRKGG